MFKIAIGSGVPDYHGFGRSRQLVCKHYFVTLRVLAQDTGLKTHGVQNCKLSNIQLLQTFPPPTTPAVTL